MANDLTKMPIAEYQSQLDRVSIHNGVSYGRLVALQLFQSTYKDDANKYFVGFRCLADSFKCCFLETAEHANVGWLDAQQTSLSEFYPFFRLRITQSFRSLCATEQAAINGYPISAYAMLRNVFDDLVMISACVQNITDFLTVEGVVSGASQDPKSQRKSRKTEERKVFAKMTGSTSNLSKTTQNQLQKWDEMYDLEVHGSRISIGKIMKGLGSEALLEFYPDFDEFSHAVFVNRYCEVAWMAHRLVPAMIPYFCTPPDAWEDHWTTIDRCFRQMSQSLSDDCGKPIGSAIVELVEAKFPRASPNFFKA